MSDSEEDFDYSDEDEDMDESANAATEDGVILLENNFYQAEDIKRSNPSKSIELFQEVILLADQLLQSTTSPERAKSWKFKAAVNILALHFSQKNIADALSQFKSFLMSLDVVPRAESSNAVETLLDIAAQHIDDQATLAQVYRTTLEHISLEESERLYYNVNVKLGALLLAKKSFAELRQLLDSVLPVLSKSIKLNSSTKYGSESYVLEMFNIEISLYQLTDDTQKVKQCYSKMMRISNDTAVQDPRIMASLYEIGAKIDMEEQRWTTAYTQFLDAFKSYEEAGMSRAKQILKYVLLANMIALKDINPFDSQEAKAYQEDNELKDMVALRAAFDNLDIKSFESILNKEEAGIKSDDYMMKYINQLLKNIRKKVLVSELRPFQTVSWKFLAKTLNGTTENVIEDLLRELIIEGELEAEINESQKIVELMKDNVSSKMQKLKEEKLKLILQITTDLQESIQTMKNNLHKILQGSGTEDNPSESFNPDIMEVRRRLIR